MNELLPFDSDIHEDLFKLFILASNERLFKGTDYWSIGDVHYMHSFQFNDRSIAPVEYEGWVNRLGLDCIKKKLTDFYCHRENPCMGGDKKLIYRIEE